MKPLFQTIADGSNGVSHPIFSIGAVVVVGQAITAVLVSLLPELEQLLRITLLILSFIISALHLSRAIQNRKSVRKKRVRPPRQAPPMPLSLLLCISALSLTACTAIHSTTYDPQTHKKTSTMTALAFWDSHGTLSQFSNATNGTMIGSIEGNTTSTNLNVLIGAIVSAAVSAAK